MILQALYEYGQRKATVLAPEGFDWKEIPFVCRISQDGGFIGFEDTRQSVDNKKIAKSFLVPALGEQKGNGIKANLLWENAEYFFGIPTKETSKASRVAEQAAAFREKIKLSVTDSSKAPWKATLQFLESLPLDDLKQQALWPEICLPTSLIILAMDGIGVLTEHPDITTCSDEPSQPSDECEFGFSLISGKKVELARLLPAIQGIRDANATGASFVAVNN